MTSIISNQSHGVTARLTQLSQRFPMILWWHMVPDINYASPLRLKPSSSDPPSLSTTLPRQTKLPKISMSSPHTLTDCTVSFSKPPKTYTLVWATWSPRGFASSCSVSKANSSNSSNCKDYCILVENKISDPGITKRFFFHGFGQQFCLIKGPYIQWKVMGQGHLLPSHIDGKGAGHPYSTLCSTFYHEVQASHLINNLCRNPKMLDGSQSALQCQWVKHLEIEICCKHVMPADYIRLLTCLVLAKLREVSW